MERAFRSFSPPANEAVASHELRMKQFARHFTPKKSGGMLSFTAKPTKLSLQRASF